ncbi:uncharacterized protein [Procambarus clarkii]|uniref:uncharacterized protein isoform X1 n=2 Tax=Procambarus clarkii TaxID=6728 RepID=UPI00374287B9
MGCVAVLESFLLLLLCCLSLRSTPSEASTYLRGGDDLATSPLGPMNFTHAGALLNELRWNEVASRAMREGLFEKQFMVQLDNTMRHPLCPQLYTKVGQYCLSIFFVSSLNWVEARNICQTIGGDLLTLSDDPAFFPVLLTHLSQQQVTVDLWIGGRYESTGWNWIDNSSMILGSPFWAIRHVEQCIPRRVTIPGPDPNTTVTTEANNGQCYHHVQSPNTPPVGDCAALTYPHYHYITDQDCFSKRSPLCIYQGQQNPEDT